MPNAVRIIGAGLAGAEAAFQLAERGIPVRLYEMKPGKKARRTIPTGLRNSCVPIRFGRIGWPTAQDS